VDAERPQLDNLSDRYPLIVEAALRNRSSSFVIDGEAVLLGVDGVSDFNGRSQPQARCRNRDMLMSDGDHLRELPLTMRKSCPAAGATR
jgi:bifunctional non-homologous end joining protein LigD